MENTVGFVVLQSQHAPVHSQQQIEDWWMLGGFGAATGRTKAGGVREGVDSGEDCLLGLVFVFLSGFGPLVWALAI